MVITYFFQTLDKGFVPPNPSLSCWGVELQLILRSASRSPRFTELSPCKSSLLAVPGRDFTHLIYIFAFAAPPSWVSEPIIISLANSEDPSLSRAVHCSADRLGFYDRYALLGTILYIGILIGEVPINRLIQVSYSETSERGSRSDASLSFFFSSRVFLVAFPDSTYIQASQWARYMLGYSRALPRRLSQLVRLDGSSVPPRSLREWSSAYPGESSTFWFESVLSALSGGFGSIRHSSKSSEISKSTSDREERPWLT